MEWVGQAEGEGSGGLQAGDIGSMLSTPWGGFCSHMKTQKSL